MTKAELVRLAEVKRVAAEAYIALGSIDTSRMPMEKQVEMEVDFHIAAAEKRHADDSYAAALAEYMRENKLISPTTP